MIATYQPNSELLPKLQNISIPMLFHVLITYFNLDFLIPCLLLNKRYVTYLAALLLSISFIVYPITFSLYLFNREQVGIESIWDFQFLLYTGLSVSYTIIISSSIKLIIEGIKKENEAGRVELLKKEVELKYLKSQINPHFLFNSLNNLYALTLKKSDYAPEVILKLSELLRYLLYDANAEKVELEKEWSYLENYVHLEKLRFGERADIQIRKSGNLANLKIESMLLLPFIENAFKHGLVSSVLPGYIHIYCDIQGDTFFFTVKNNVGNKKKVLQLDKGGIGLKNVRDRLNLVYPSKHTLNFIETETMFRVDLILELA